jgi:hypothetical protein
MVQMQTLKDKNKSSKICLKLVVQCNCKRDEKLQFIAIADKAGNCSSTNLKKRLEMYGSMQITKLIGNFCSKFKAFIAEDI